MSIAYVHDILQYILSSYEIPLDNSLGRNMFLLVKGVLLTE